MKDFEQRDFNPVVDFFIVGGPKCGTTALFEYLRTHPQIYLPLVKEPSFFAYDIPGYRDIEDFLSYQALFKNAKPEEVRGEASVVYLYSNEAIQAIYDYNPCAKIIIMVRHPVDMFRSLHMQLTYTFNEDVKDPESAWQLQEMRKMGKAIPRLCRDPKLLQYREFCSLGTQIEKVLNVFPPEQVLILSVKELKTDALKFYHKVLQFIDVEDDGKTFFPKVNTSKTHRILWVGKLLWLIGTKNRKTIKKSMGSIHSPVKKAILNMGLWFNQLNSISMDKYPLNDAFLDKLYQKFSTEVEILKKYVNEI